MQEGILTFDEISRNGKSTRCRTGCRTQHKNSASINKMSPPRGSLIWRDVMEKTETKIGGVTYYVSRTFIGSRTATELLIDHVVDRAREDVAVDVIEKPAV